ncbi:hypothetical protein [Peribacillus simplex]|uniref:hypothetical protein n=1 Tax=Peribacillus simplex TaxID=1478 RepID=UPI003D2DE867
MNIKTTIDKMVVSVCRQKGYGPIQNPFHDFVYGMITYGFLLFPHKFAKLLANNWLAETPEKFASRRLGDIRRKGNGFLKTKWNL